MYIAELGGPGSRDEGPTRDLVFLALDMLLRVDQKADYKTRSLASELLGWARGPRV